MSVTDGSVKLCSSGTAGVVALNAPADALDVTSAYQDIAEGGFSTKSRLAALGGNEPTFRLCYGRLTLGDDRSLADRRLADRSLTDRSLADHGGRGRRLTGREISSGCHTHESESRSRNQKKLFHDCALVLETIPTCMVKTTLIKSDLGF
jgi:hypothetical protein